MFITKVENIQRKTQFAIMLSLLLTQIIKPLFTFKFNCIGTIIKSDSDLFKVGETLYANAITSIVKTDNSINLSNYSTITSANNSNDLMFGDQC